MGQLWPGAVRAHARAECMCVWDGAALFFFFSEWGEGEQTLAPSLHFSALQRRVTLSATSLPTMPRPAHPHPPPDPHPAPLLTDDQKAALDAALASKRKEKPGE
jgi:hypothetical protein